MAVSKTAKQLAATLVIGLTLRFVLTKAGWHAPSLAGNRILPALSLWVIFGIYWGIAGLNSAPSENSESRLSTYFHQFLLGVAMLLVILPLPGLNGWFLPPDSLMIIAAGGIVQAGFMLLAFWARMHLGRNWSAEVRIAVDHQLVRSGPYRMLRHPIYTAMLGMFLGTAIAVSQYHALIGLALLVVAYLRKTRLEGSERTRKTTLRSERRSALKKYLTGPTLLEISGCPRGARVACETACPKHTAPN